MRVRDRLPGRRTLLGVGLGVGAVLGLTACETGGLNTAAVAFTTDQVGTRELERRDVDVSWMTCTGSYDGDGQGTKSPSASVNTVVNVDCQGETKSGKDIDIKGKVTREVNGKCVRGDLTATVGGKKVFRVDVLGNCDAADPTAPGGGPEPTVTVTVTKTVYCQTKPTCWPEGK
jgi:hypothetical protein